MSSRCRAIPRSVTAGPISPTDGHQFTNPSVNFGGEHFGVGFYGTGTSWIYVSIHTYGAASTPLATSTPQGRTWAMRTEATRARASSPTSTPPASG